MGRERPGDAVGQAADDASVDVVEDPRSGAVAGLADDSVDLVPAATERVGEARSHHRGAARKLVIGEYQHAHRSKIASIRSAWRMVRILIGNGLKRRAVVARPQRQRAPGACRRAARTQLAR
jgi:hypothetical protein